MAPLLAIPIVQELGQITLYFLGSSTVRKKHRRIALTRRKTVKKL
jgi:hypothetical protein